MKYSFVDISRASIASVFLLIWSGCVDSVFISVLVCGVRKCEILIGRFGFSGVRARGHTTQGIESAAATYKIKILIL